jgi:predicted acyl esterase
MAEAASSCPAEAAVDRLTAVAPELARILTRGSVDAQSPVRFSHSQIRRETLRVVMRDGIRLAIDLYLPPTLPAPAIAMRTPYGRCSERVLGTLMAFAQRGYVVISQDCRGTGDSEPDVWDYSVYEPEDGMDFVEWATKQSWFNGQLFSFGGSYVSATQWCMSAHPAMSGIAPEVGGLQVSRRTVRHHMFVNGYARTVGKGSGRLPIPIAEIERAIEAETMASGYFNPPLRSPLPDELLDRLPGLRTLPLSEARRRIWVHYRALPPGERAALLKQLTGTHEFSYVEMSSLQTIFDCLITYGAHTIPSATCSELCERFHAPALIVTGWYDWNLPDTLPSWTAFRLMARPEVAARSRLIITPSAHNTSGYHEGQADHPELQHSHRYNVDLLLRWYDAVRQSTTASWPVVIYYLMGANDWRAASDWPIPEAHETALYLGSSGTLSSQLPGEPSEPDCYTYDPGHPTPTVGGSILSYLYPPGSVDVSHVQKRKDVLTYTTPPLARDLDVVGPLRMILYVSSSATDTDFAARLSDVFPNGRAIQLQNGMLRARFRNLTGEPELLKPGHVYRLEIDMGATANRFKAGHCLRVDISSADFPRFDRNSNRGGDPGPPLTAVQTVYHEPTRPSHLSMSVLGSSPVFGSVPQ